MEIHKPKPWHGFSEFLKEYLIIVVGVLTALAGEQGVEWLHWRHEVADTREALTGELSNNLEMIRDTRAEMACNLAHLDALEAWAKGRASENPNPRFRPPRLSSVQMAVWDVAKTGQAVGHIPLHDQLAYSRLYTGLNSFSYLVTTQRDTWREITRFADKATLSTAEAAQLLEAVSVARNQASIWEENARDLGGRAKTMGAWEPAARPPLKVPEACQPESRGPLGAAPRY